MSFILPAEVLVHVVLERLVPRERLGVAERAGELRGGARVEARVPLVVALREELGVAVLALELAHPRVPRLVRPLFGREGEEAAHSYVGQVRSTFSIHL